MAFRPIRHMDNATHRSAAAPDPTGFLSRLDKPVVIDEVQRVPELFLAIKEDVDRNRQPGRYLSGIGIVSPEAET